LFRFILIFGTDAIGFILSAFRAGILVVRAVENSFFTIGKFSDILNRLAALEIRRRHTVILAVDFDPVFSIAANFSFIFFSHGFNLFTIICYYSVFQNECYILSEQHYPFMI